MLNLLMRNRVEIILISGLLTLILFVVGFLPVFSTTWSDQLHRVTTHAYFDGFPTVAEMSDGKIWIVWTRSILGNYTLFYKNSSDLGGTWGSVFNLTDEVGLGDNTSPSIMQAENNTIWLVWTSNRPSPSPPPTSDFHLAASPNTLTIQQNSSDTSNITVTSINNFNELVNLTCKSPPLGVNTTFTPPQVTPPQNATANSTLTVSVESWIPPQNTTLTVLGKSSGLTHQATIALEIVAAGGAASSKSSSDSSPPSEATIDYELYYRTSHDNGATWSEEVQLTNNTYDDLSPSIVQLSNGTILVAWQRGVSGNPDVYIKTTQDGTSWSNATPVTTDSGLDKAPSITQTKDGTIWMVWYSMRTGDYEIYYKTYDGISWSSDNRLTFDVNSTDVSPVIYQTVDDVIWIFWSATEDGPNSTGDVFYKSSSDNGGSWSETVQYTTNNYEDAWPGVTQSRDTKIWVVWTSDRAEQPDGNWDIYYRTSLAGDVNDDGAVDVFDLSIVGMAYGTFEGMPSFNPTADINKDGIVDMRDLAIVTLYYGET